MIFIFSKLVFIFLSIAFFLLGVLFIKKSYQLTALKVFLTALFIIPSAPFLSKFYFNSQIYAWYFFIIAPLIVFFIKTLKSNRLNFVAVKFIAGLILFVAVTLSYGLIIEEKSLLYIALDFKVILIFLFAITIILMSRTIDFDLFESRLWKELLFVNFILDSVFFFLNLKFNIAYAVTGDGHYLNELGRYSDLSIAFLVLFIIFKFVNKQSISLKHLIYTILPIIYSGNRTLIFVVLLIMLLHIILRTSFQRKILFGTFFLLMISTFGVIVSNSNEDSFLYRIKSLGDTSFIKQKLESRFEPVFYEIADWDRPIYWLMGKGLGKSIYIPWFEYRENIDNFNPFLDNIYLTLFIKFGFLSIFIYLFLYRYFYCFSRSNVFSLVLMFYLLVMGLTTAFIYQATFLVFLISPIFFSIPKKKLL